MKRAFAVVVTLACAGVVVGALWPADDGSADSPREQGRLGVGRATEPPASALGKHGVAPAGVNARVVRVEEGPVETDPKAPGYDPTKLTHFGATSTEIFEREPRDPIWASAMEDRMRKRMAADLAIVQPAARVTSVECRTSTCEFTIDASEHLSESTHFALQLLGSADVHSIAHAERFDDGRETMRMHALYTPAHRGLDDHAAYYELRREALLRQAQAGEEYAHITLPLEPDAE